MSTGAAYAPTLAAAAVSVGASKPDGIDRTAQDGSPDHRRFASSSMLNRQRFPENSLPVPLQLSNRSASA